MILIKRLDHVQICIPTGKEEEARAFYHGILRFKEIPKPASLLANGGLWYRVGDIELHIGVEEVKNNNSKRHPAFEVKNIQSVRTYLDDHGVKTRDEQSIPNVDRFSFYDPFGNRIEFLERKIQQPTSYVESEEAIVINETVSLDQTKKAVQEQFGKSALGYVSSQGHAKGPDLMKLVEISGAQQEDRVLDIATGGGHVANALAPLVNHVVALDLTVEILEVAKDFISGNGHQNVEYVQGDAESLPFEDASFEIVTCRIAPHHFPNIERFIEESFRVLKPGGCFLLVDNVAPENDEVDRFYNDVEKRRDYSHFRAWKKSEWLKMLEEVGYEIDEWHRFVKVFGFEGWCRRMKLSDSERDTLNEMMINTSPKVKDRLRITFLDDQVKTFQGESILLKATKPEEQDEEHSMLW